MWRVIVQFREPEVAYPVSIHAFQGSTQEQAVARCAEHFGVGYAELVDVATRTNGATMVRIELVPEQSRG